MFQPEITSHSDYGVAAQFIRIEHHGCYDVATVTLALVTDYLAEYTTPELRKAMARNYRSNEGVNPELAKIRRAELLFMATEYPSLYMPGMIQEFGLQCDTQGRYWLPVQPEEPASPFVADPANPTDAELGAAVERGLADGSLIDSADFLARAAENDADATDQAPVTEVAPNVVVIAPDAAGDFLAAILGGSLANTPTDMLTAAELAWLDEMTRPSI